MIGPILELLIIGVIILGIGVAIWKGGSANPEGTRALGVKVSQVSTDVGKLSGKMTTMSTRMQHVEGDVEELKRESATTKDIQRLEDLLKRTHTAVHRIESVLIEKGLGK